MFKIDLTHTILGIEALARPLSIQFRIRHAKWLPICALARSLSIRVSFRHAKQFWVNALARPLSITRWFLHPNWCSHVTPVDKNVDFQTLGLNPKLFSCWRPTGTRVKNVAHFKNFYLLLDSNILEHCCCSSWRGRSTARNGAPSPYLAFLLQLGRDLGPIACCLRRWWGGAVDAHPTTFTLGFRVKRLGFLDLETYR